MLVTAAAQPVSLDVISWRYESQSCKATVDKEGAVGIVSTKISVYIDKKKKD